MRSNSPDPRAQSLIDCILAEFEQALRTAWVPGTIANRPSPATVIKAEPLLAEPERALSEGLMRVNHTGEIAAQALYRGQALVARNSRQQTLLLAAADEEQDHLAWCQQRLQELDGHCSYLAPFWYSGSFLIGTLAGLAGDRWSLGFIEETEKQVSEHLSDHLEKLPETDHKSRAILTQMRIDESSHAAAARAEGARELPEPVKNLMTRIADFMRFISFRI